MLRIRHVLAALLLHAALLAVVLVGVYFNPVIRPLPVIEAVLITAKHSPKAEPKEEPKPKKDQKPEVDEQKQEKIEQAKQVELQRKAELEKKAELERKRIADELKLKKLEEQERKKQMEQEEKQVAENKLKREQQAEKQRQQDLKSMLEQEKQGRVATERDKWAALIQNIVRRNWVRPINSADKFECNVSVQLLPGGTVVNVKLTRSCGSPALDESVKRAVLKSDPLPSPSDPDVFDRNLNFIFVPNTN